MCEVWKKVDWIPQDFYEISNKGNCRSVDHYGWSRHHVGKNMFFKGKLLNGDVGEFGKRRYSLGGKKIFAHILVVKAFPEICGEWYEGCEVHHKDYDPSNNEATNLVVLSPEEHKKLHTSIGQYKGLNNPFYGKKHTKATIKRIADKRSKAINQYDLNGNFLKAYKSCTECEKVTGYMKASLNRCCLGKQATAYGFKWSYASSSSPLSSAG